MGRATLNLDEPDLKGSCDLHFTPPKVPLQGYLAHKKRPPP